MGKYVYIDENSSKGKFAIGLEVFRNLTNEALGRIPGLVSEPVEKGSSHRLQVNNSEIEIHKGVVHVKVYVNAKKDFSIDEIKKLITDEINSSFMMVAEQVPTEVKIKIDNII